MSLAVPRRWHGPLIRVIFVIVIYMLALRWAPDNVLPFSVSALLGSWLGASIAPAPVASAGSNRICTAAGADIADLVEEAARLDAAACGALAAAGALAGWDRRALMLKLVHQEWAGEFGMLSTRRGRARFALSMLAGMPAMAVTLRRPCLAQAKRP